MNPIFGKPAGGSGDIGPAALIQRLMGLLHGNDPQQVTQLLAKQNPQFAQFMRSCAGKTPAQVAKENGLDFEQIKQMF